MFKVVISLVALALVLVLGASPALATVSFVVAAHSVGLIVGALKVTGYAIFFGYGALYFDSEDHEGRLGRRWWLTLPLALLVVYPAGLAATYGGAKLRGIATLLQVIYVWMMSAAMMGLFRRFVSQERPWIRPLASETKR